MYLIFKTFFLYSLVLAQNKIIVNSNYNGQILQVIKSNGTVENWEYNALGSMTRYYVTVSAANLSSTVVSLPGRLEAGSNVQVSVTEQNSGTLVAGTHRLFAYLSPNATYEPEDLVLAGKVIVSLSPGGSQTENLSLQIPSDLLSGVWYLILYADAEKKVFEKNETDNITVYSFNVANCSNMGLTLATSNDVCGTGKGLITAKPTGGYGVYSFEWSTGETTATINKPEGTYSVTVRDAVGCKVSKSSTILSSLPLSVVVSKKDAYCGTGGEITLQVSGGSPNYTYLWSELSAQTAKLTGLSKGNFTAQITDANQCRATVSVTIDGSTKPIANANKLQDANCGLNMGVISLSPQYGLPPYNITCDGVTTQGSTIQNLSGGTHQIVIKDQNNCQSTESIVINKTDAINITVKSKTNVLCETKGSAEIAVTGGSGNYTATWSDGFQGLQLKDAKYGIYSVNVSDNNFTCIATQTISIGSAANTFGLIGDIDLSNCKAIINVSSGSGYTYYWNGVVAPSTMTINTNTQYTVNVVDGFGCSKTLLIPAVNCTGIDEINKKLEGIRLYPNPTQGALTIKPQNVTITKIEILDISGKVFYTENTEIQSNVEKQISLHNISKGTYVLKCHLKGRDAVFSRTFLKH